MQLSGNPGGLNIPDDRHIDINAQDADNCRSMKQNRVIHLFIIFTSFFICSCTLDYSRGSSSEELDKDIPNTVINNFKHIAVSGGAPSFRIEAAVAKTYDKQAKTVMTEIYFEEYGKDLEVVRFGKGDSAVLYTDTEDAEITGSIEFYSSEEEAWLWSEYLYWNEAEKTLTGKDHDTVRINTDEGTKISGKGFMGNMKTMTFSYNKNVEGSYESDR